MKKKLNQLLGKAMCYAQAKNFKALTIAAITIFFLFLSAPIFAQISISGSQGQQASSDGGITPLYQKIYNVLSILVVLSFLIYIVKPVKGLMSSETGTQGQDGEKKAHLMQVAISVITVIIWFTGIPYFLQLAFK